MLKELYEKEIRNYWKNPKMVDYELKVASELIQTKTGHILVVEKERIETHFCFGYGYGTEYEDAEEMRENVNINYFIEENLRDINHKIKFYKENNLYVISRYWGQAKDSLLGQVICEERVIDCEDAIKMDEEDKAKLIEALEKEKEKFIKRLRTYLKRYGLSKLKTWTYWREE